MRRVLLILCLTIAGCGSKGGSEPTASDPRLERLGRALASHDEEVVFDAVDQAWDEAIASPRVGLLRSLIDPLARIARGPAPAATRNNAIHALSAFEAHALSAARVLIEVAGGDADEDLRAGALETLAAIASPKTWDPLNLDILEDEGLLDYRAHARVSELARTAIVAGLADPAADVQREAVKALASWGTLARDEARLVVPFALALDPEMRCAAVDTLGALEAPADVALDALLEVLRRGHTRTAQGAYCQRRTLRVIQAMGPSARRALPAVRALRADEDIRSTVEATIAALEGAAAEGR